MRFIVAILVTAMAFVIWPISAASSDQAAADPPAVERVAGPDRFATAARISDLWPAGQAVVFVANGGASADALTASSRAGAVRAPVLLVSRNAVPSTTAAALERLRPGRIVVTGGSAVVTDAVLASLKRFSTRGIVERVEGPSRFATADKMAAKYAPSSGPVVLANGETLADAVSGTALAGHLGQPLLLAKQGELSDGTRRRLAELEPSDVIVLGGKNALTDAVARQAAQQSTSGSYRRLAGADRYATAAAVAEEFPSDAQSIYVASGTSFVDALVGGAAAARQRVPLILTPRDFVASGTRRALERILPSRVVVLGGTQAVSALTARSLGASPQSEPTPTPSSPKVALLGGYLGSPSEEPDQQFNAAFGSYPEVASTYYQADGRPGGKLNVSYERGRVQRGTIPMLTVTSTRGPWTMSDIASGKADAWIDRWRDELASVGGEVWFTFDHEFEVKLNQGKFPDNPSLMEYARAYNRFMSRVQAGAPNVRSVYWYGYSDKAKIDAIGGAISSPDIVAFDPYVFSHHQETTSFEQMVSPKLTWLRSRSWFKGQPIVLGEFAKDTSFGDERVASFADDLRPTMDRLGIDAGLWFARDKPGDIMANISKGWPKARAAFSDSVSP